MESHHDKIMSQNYAQDQAGPDSRLLRPEQKMRQEDFFVTAQWLKEAIDQGLPNLVVLDVTRGQGNYKLDQTRVAEDYFKGHIPSAIHLNTDELGEFKDYFESAEKMRDIFLSKGLDQNSIVVFYSIYARDIIYIASRMAFAAYYLGVDQVKILDGGLQAWQRAGYAMETKENFGIPLNNFGCSLPKRPEIYVRTPKDLITYLNQYPDTVLASVRTWNEFLGVNEGHAWNKGVGEIAGAVYLGDELLANVNGELADPVVYLDLWRSWGIEKDKQVLLYCGTSWRSSTAFFVMKHLGWSRVAMFDGSWFKYYIAHREDPATYPIQRGNPKGQPPLQVISE